MNLNQVIFLDSIARTGNISKAAKELFVSQPSISKSIRSLEEELGFEIIVRSRNGISFTEQGELVLKNAQDIVRSVNEINALASNKPEPNKTTTIKLGVVPMLAQTHSLDLISSLQSEGMDVIYSTNSRSSIMRKLQDGSLDVGIVLSNSSDCDSLHEEIEKATLQTIELDKGKIVFLVRKGHPLTSADVPSIEDVVEYQYLTSGDPLVAESTKQYLQTYGYNQEVKIIRDSSLLQKYLRQSDCVKSVPSLCVDRALKDGGLNAIEPTGYDWTYTLLLVFAPGFASIQDVDNLHKVIHATIKK